MLTGPIEKFNVGLEPINGHLHTNVLCQLIPQRTVFERAGTAEEGLLWE